MSTPSVVLPGYPPRGGVPGPWYPSPRGGGTWTSVPPLPPGGVPGPQYPPRGGGGYPDLSTPPGGYPDLGTPPGGVPRPQYPPGGGGTRTSVPPPAASWHSGKCCKALWDMGTPPCGQTDGWMEGQTRVKTLPSLVLRTRAVMKATEGRCRILVTCPSKPQALDRPLAPAR